MPSDIPTCISEPATLAAIAQSAMGSPVENAMVNSLIAGSYGTTPQKVPPIATMLAAPLLRGQVVKVEK